jgi:hypothetical protein
MVGVSAGRFFMYTTKKYQGNSLVERQIAYLDTSVNVFNALQPAYHQLLDCFHIDGLGNTV